jgi:hypothetical protein
MEATKTPNSIIQKIEAESENIGEYQSDESVTHFVIHKCLHDSDQHNYL